MNGPITTEETYHISNILKHYAHAKEKHPYFCDEITAFNTHVATFRLKQTRDLIDWRKSKGCVTAEMLARCELLEAEEAFLSGDKHHAVEECYDAIAVLLRTIDVLEGRQKLGKPETKGESEMIKHATTEEAAKCEGLDYLCDAGLDNTQIDNLVSMRYFTQPASKGHHLAEVGGLVKHSVNVTSRLVQLTEALSVKWSRKESPYLVGMLHDLVKCRCYRAVCAEGCREPKWEYVQPVYPGHGVCSIAMAEELHIRLMPDEIAAIIYHMGMFSVGKEYTDKEFYAAMDLYAPQILATHSADWYASAVDENKKGENK